ncbi:hypothetical protein K490DRAFT_65010 [Saccharata proteae CBS 121410]|uniref:Hydrophobin n=1 Tax=Saccharata proteae CBS 121410 TaxID=1314787 RepID=A0A9P4M0X7_9PEZI|nr:hypothetical protein K490DRAFT_65010 [Saccharata proteae CBS 121410]
MKASTITSILSLAVFAAAAPSTEKRGSSCTLGKASSQCSSSQTISCCNNDDEVNASGLLGGLIGNILGGSCSGISADILDILDGKDASDVCGSNTVSCCEGSSDTGLINVDLSCLSIL